MSATTECLFEQLILIEASIKSAEDSGNIEEKQQLVEQRESLLKRLESCNKALSESKQVLKG